MRFPEKKKRGCNSALLRHHEANVIFSFDCPNLKLSTFFTFLGSNDNPHLSFIAPLKI